MKAFSFLVLLAVLLNTGPCNAIEVENLDALSATGTYDAARLILVTFVDRTIRRAATGSRVNFYRRRGPYRGSSWSDRIVKKISKDYRITEVSQWPITELGIHCVVYEVPVGQDLEVTLDRLRHDELIEAAQGMSVFQAMGSRYSDPYFRLQRNIESMDVAEAHRRATGRNIQIAVIDTGIDDSHPDLNGQITASKNFTSNQLKTSAADLHGTAVAGVIGAVADNGAGIVGVAPDAKIIALKACWPIKPGTLEAACNTFTLALAMNTAIRLRPDVLNLSLTGPDDPLLRRLIDRAVQTGITVVAAGSEETGSAANFPASMNNVIAVRRTDEVVHQATGNECLTAPGSEILTTLPDGAYNFVSGSSLSAAHVSGVIALMLETKRDLTPKQINRILRFSAHHRRSPKHASLAVNASAAIDNVQIEN